MSAALRTPSSNPPEAPDASERFFQLIMNGKLEQLGDEAFDVRDDVDSVVTVGRREPRMVTRTAEEQDAMMNWRRRPLAEGLFPREEA